MSSSRVTTPGFQTGEKLAEAVLHHLARDIVEGRLEPGTHLIELHLSQELGVSRSPIREAIHRLAAEGLVELLPRRGAFVVALSPKEVEDVFVVRGQLERLTARLAAQRTTEAGVSELRTINQELAALARSGDVSGFFGCNGRFHAKIAQVADNTYLQRLQYSAAQRTFRPLFLYLSTPSHLIGSVHDHAGLIEAIASGHGGRADRLMAEHVRTAAVQALALLKAVSPDPTAAGVRRDRQPREQRG